MTVPPLADYLRWMREMPSVFRAEPEGLTSQGVTVRVRAVVADLFESLTATPPAPALLDAFTARVKSAQERNRLRYVLAACHLLWHPSFRDPALGAGAGRADTIESFLVQTVSMVASVTQADSLVTDEERCEELVRRALDAFGLRLPGESEVEANDRLTQVNSIERRRLLSEVAKRQEKLRREAEIRRRAQEEAASKAPRE